MRGRTVIIVAPAAVCARYEGQTFTEGQTMTVGKVTYEREGVADRRGFISHAWPPGGLGNVKRVLKQKGHLDKVQIRSKVPGDWRWTEDIPRQGAR